MTHLPQWLTITLLVVSALAIPSGLFLAHLKNTRDFKRLGLSGKDLRALYCFYFLGKGQPPKPITTPAQE